ncbi:MAG: signal peptidase I [Dysgonamonadaceae bacterium]|jgi:signal peptidase I|nr:signal peptidase I [Dysgonamonadaceae bacterium]
MDNTVKKSKPFQEHLRQAKKSQWIKFALLSLLLIGFCIWVGNYWLLLIEFLIFDIYISRFITWDAWKHSKNKGLRTIADWADAIIFALIAVSLIHIFIFQNYKIPTSSLEKSLLVGDYLLVSKLSYGPRVPNTPLAMPLTHHTMPVLNTKSYSDWPYWDYKRLKGFGHVKRNDIVVFNFPAGDTVALYAQDRDYYDLVYKNGWKAVNENKRIYGDVIYRPVDRRENYVKRCIGMPGDSLQIINNQVYINGEILPNPKKLQFNYFVETQGARLSEKQFRKLDVSPDDRHFLNEYSDPIDAFNALGIEPNAAGGYNPVYILPLTQEALTYLQKAGWARSVRLSPPFVGDRTYPYTYDTGWTRDDFGPLWIPKKGETIVLNEENLALYSRCIINYENNTLRRDGDKIYINDVPTNSYTFKYDYYFMMGDNRHNSLDSRYWGFVPEDHIVGQPLLIWLSLDKDRGLFDGKVRWKRLFRLVKNQ